MHWALWEAYRRKGMQKEAILEWEKVWQLAGRNDRAATIRHDFEEGGYKGVLLGQVRHLKQQSATRYVSPVDLALQYAQLGRREETLALLEEGYRQHSPLLIWIGTGRPTIFSMETIATGRL